MANYTDERINETLVKERLLTEAASAYLASPSKAYETEIMSHAYSIIQTAIRKRIPLDDAIDVIQSSAEKVLDSLRKGKLKYPESVGGWIYTIANNAVVDYCRRSTRRTLQLNDPYLFDEGNPEQEYELRLELEAVQGAIQELPPNQQRAMILHYINDMDLDQVAEALGTNKGNVRVILHRARSRIKKRVLEAA